MKALLAACALGVLVPTELPDFQGLAAAYRERVGAPATEPGEGDLSRLLDSDAFARVQLGAFDVRYPVEFLGEKRLADDFKEIALVLLEIQGAWLDWLEREDLDTDPARDDLEVLRRWVKGWKARSLANLAKSKFRDLYEKFDAKESVRESGGHLKTFLLSGRAEGNERGASDAVQLVFSPTRRDFMELVGFVGWLYPHRQPEIWTESTGEWTYFWASGAQLIALEYPEWPVTDLEFRRGVDMSVDDDTALLQHVVERATHAFVWNLLGPTNEVFIESGLCLEMSLEVCGKNDVRIGGASWSSPGSTTAPYERFVPGGNSAGGTLPARGAGLALREINQWRVGAGTDHFTKPLRRGQKAGAKERRKSKEKDAHFELLGDDRASHHVVSAPFFLPEAPPELPPEEFVSDYEEFFRSYRAAFLHWIRTQAAGRESQARFATLLQRWAGRDHETTFSGLVNELYGMPLSARDSSTESLEWRFLDWLSK